jgi:hypothetical protein
LAGSPISIALMSCGNANLSPRTQYPSDIHGRRELSPRSRTSVIG